VRAHEPAPPAPPLARPRMREIGSERR